MKKSWTLLTTDVILHLAMVAAFYKGYPDASVMIWVACVVVDVLLVRALYRESPNRLS